MCYGCGLIASVQNGMFEGAGVGAVLILMKDFGGAHALCMFGVSVAVGAAVEWTLFDRKYRNFWDKQKESVEWAFSPPSEPLQENSNPPLSESPQPPLINEKADLTLPSKISQDMPKGPQTWSLEE